MANKIVDERGVTRLSKFGDLPGGCIFEFPGWDVLLMKYPDVWESRNAIVISNDAKRRNVYHFNDDDRVLALDTELHIKGLVNY